MIFLDRSFVGIDPFLGSVRANGLQGGGMDYPGLRMGAAGCGEAVDDQVNLPQIFFYELNDLVLHVVRKGIAIDAGIQPRLIGKAMESRGVPPAVPGFLSVPGFSKNTPMVAAPAPKAAVIREASP